MAIMRALVRFPAASLDTEDDVTNTWHFDLTTFEEGDITPVETALDTFYTSFITSLAASHTWSSGRIKWYNLADTEPRAPVKDTAFVISGTASANQLPRELAICLSFQGSQISGIRQARRRGRVYLGPFGTGANGTDGMIATSLTTTISTAAGVLLGASAAASNWAWIVYSPTMGEGAPVDNGWVDNAWDVQRRRGVDASVRTTFG